MSQRNAKKAKLNDDKSLENRVDMLENKLKTSIDKINNKFNNIKKENNNFKLNVNEQIDNLSDTMNDLYNEINEIQDTIDEKDNSAHTQLISIMDSVMGKSIDLNKEAENLIKELKLKKKKHDKLLKQTLKYINYCKINKIKNNIDEIKYFIKLDKSKRKNIIKSLLDIINTNNDTLSQSYYLKTLNTNMNAYNKRQILSKINQLKGTNSALDTEYYKIKDWIDTALNIPWGKYKDLSFNNKEINNYLINARKTLDTEIYGHHETKDIIIQIIGKIISNKQKTGNVFALYGPPGVGKTTIIKNGLSKVLDLPFGFISLGGASDASSLNGHGYTYLGSKNGKIVDILLESQYMNPVIYFDELDKVSNSHKGQEIINLLIHLTDPVQSESFQDKYLGSMNIDISKCIFIFSFNDINLVNHILLDRMKLIYVKGYNTKEKLIIIQNYILPRYLKEYKLYDENNNPIINFSNDNLKFIVNYDMNNYGINKEDGMRKIEQYLEKICSQINIIRLVNNKWTGAIHSILDNINELKNINSYPIQLSNDIIYKLLKIKNIENNNVPFGMYV